MYGAVAGATDGGFGGFTTQADAAMLVSKGNLDYETLYMWSYKAHWELSKIGKQFTRNFFNMKDAKKLYSYYQGCSEGGREGNFPEIESGQEVHSNKVVRKIRRR